MCARQRAKIKRAGNNRTKRTRSAPRRASNARQFKGLLEWLLPRKRIFAGLGLHGNTKWAPSALIGVALCWGWAESINVTDAFVTALDQCRQLGLMPLTTYQGFMNALVRWTDPLLALLWPLLHEHMHQIGGKFWQVGEWVPIAFDGSRGSAPRSEANEKALCAPNYGKGTTAKYRKKKSKGMRRRKNEKNKPQPQEPQAWITLLWHMRLRLPWMWRLGPSNSSERRHVSEMLADADLPQNTLFCGDAGFIGYPLWAQILSQGYHFLVRVGANVSLLAETTEWAYGKDGLVLCWPKTALQAGQPPLRLRLLKVKVGRTQMWMLTSVLDRSKLGRAQIIHLYQLRWGIELEFRGLKQTLNRAKLRCRNDRRLLAELHWSLMAMAVAELFALKEQLATARGRQGPTAEPTKRSLANTMRALRNCLHHLRDVPEAGHDLLTRLRRAVTDDYVRKSSKKARYRPPNPDKKPLGDPQIRKITLQHKNQLNAQAHKIAA
jgi:hypothetical protein